MAEFICNKVRKGKELRDYLEALDVELRPARENYLYLVEACTQSDMSKKWVKAYKTLREAASFCRKLDHRIQEFGGLRLVDGVPEVCEYTAEQAVTEYEDSVARAIAEEHDDRMSEGAGGYANSGYLDDPSLCDDEIEYTDA